MSAPVREGEILAGKYRVDKVLGVGGMGVVIAAHHIDLDDKVAIKFLLPETLNNQEAVARFAREARAAVKIKSEHVARVSDVGKLENGAPYMVMEYLEGGDLAAWLAQKGRLPIEQAVEFVLQASEAIAEAHSLGIVHRDLKPANLFVVRRADGQLSAKVLDFGISKATSLSGSGSGGSSSMTKTSALMGSPLYMSPEQMQSSKDVDARSDIWALGVILYELITGESPFTAETMPELILKIMSTPSPPLTARRPDASEGLSAVVLRCMEKDRSKRYQTIGELAVALLPFAPKRAKHSVERISGVMQAAGLSNSGLELAHAGAESERPREAIAGTDASWGKTAPGGTPGKALIGVGIGVGVGLAVLVGALVLRHRLADGTSPSTPSALSQAPLPAPPSAAPVPVPATAAPTAPATAPEPAPADSIAETPSSVGAATAVPAAHKGGAPQAPRSPAKVSPRSASAPVAAVAPPPPAPAAPAAPKKLNVFDDRK